MLFHGFAAEIALMPLSKYEGQRERPLARLHQTRRSFKTMKTCDGPQKPNNQASFLSTAENTSYYCMILPLRIRKMYSFWIFTKY